MQITDTSREIFRSSLERCQQDSKFIGLFYHKFVISNPLVREKFKHTNMDNQKMMLHASMNLIMLATQQNETASIYLDQIAKRHSKLDLDIPKELYQLWLTTLLETVKETDPDYNEEVKQAWQAIMQFGIDYMQTRYAN